MPHKRLIHLNRYQIRVLVLVLAPVVILFPALALISTLFFDQLVAAVQTGDTISLVDFLEEWKLRFLFALGGLMAIVVTLTFAVSKNLLGAFGRIFRELDEKIAGNRPGPITARKGDDLANELLRRINVLTGEAPPPGGKV